MLYGRHIRRLDTSDTHAWQVNIKRHGHAIAQYFSDSRYGGEDKALIAALRYRDIVIRKMHDIHYELWFRNLLRRNNTTGIVGVGRYIARSRSRGKVTEYPYWQAFWRDAYGKRHSRTFTVRRYGERVAKRLARRTRTQALKELAGQAKDILQRRRMTMPPRRRRLKVNT